MKLLSILFFIIPFTTSAQELTREQKKKSKILTKYVWQSSDSTKVDHKSNRTWFSDQKDWGGYTGSYYFNWDNYGTNWKWIDTKATQIHILLYFSAQSCDTLTLTNIKLTDKIFTADVKLARWGAPRYEKMQRFAVMTMEDWRKEESGELVEPKLIQYGNTL